MRRTITILRSSLVTVGAMLDVLLRALGGVSETTAVGRRPVSDARALAGQRDPNAGNGRR